MIVRYEVSLTLTATGKAVPYLTMWESRSTNAETV